jgi:hypothetical protein
MAISKESKEKKRIRARIVRLRSGHGNIFIYLGRGQHRDQVQRIHWKGFLSCGGRYGNTEN